MAGVLEGMKDESGYKSFFEKAEAGCIRISWKRLMNKKEGGESQLDVGGKELPSTFANILYVNCRDKRLSLQVRKDQLHPKRNHQENYISSPRRASTDPQRPFRRSQPPHSVGLTLPEARL
jgi:hypothetical protein